MNREGIVILWMTQYRILVIISAKERSPVLPDMLSSTYSCTVKQRIDSVKDGISKWKTTDISSLWDRQFCTKGVFRVYRISIAILILTQQRNLNQYGNEVLDNFFIIFLLIVDIESCMYYSISNFSNFYKVSFSPFFPQLNSMRNLKISFSEL